MDADGLDEAVALVRKHRSIRQCVGGLCLSLLAVGMGLGAGLSRPGPELYAPGVSRPVAYRRHSGGEVAKFLRSNGLQEHAAAFRREGYERLEELLALGETDLMALNVTSRPQRLRFVVAAARVAGALEQPGALPCLVPPPVVGPLGAALFACVLACVGAVFWSESLRGTLVHAGLVSATLAWYAARRYGRSGALEPAGADARPRRGSAGVVEETEEETERLMDVAAMATEMNLTAEDGARRLRHLRDALGPQVKLGHQFCGGEGDYWWALTRFMIVNKWDVGKAKKQLLKSVKYRKMHNMDKTVCMNELTPERKQQILDAYPFFYLGNTKDGYPMYLEETGKINHVKLFKDFTTDELLNIHSGLQEFALRVFLPARAKAAGRPCRRMVTLLDVEGINTSFIRSNVVTFFTKMMENVRVFYPEILQKSYVVNAPGVFTFIWPVAKRCLDPRVVAKITVLGDLNKISDKEREDFLEFFGRENLPRKYGGTADIDLKKLPPYEFDQDMLEQFERTMA